MTCVEEDGDLGELKRLIVLPLGVLWLETWGLSIEDISIGDISIGQDIIELAIESYRYRIGNCPGTILEQSCAVSLTVSALAKIRRSARASYGS